jgi:hypothetical protein
MRVREGAFAIGREAWEYQLRKINSGHQINRGAWWRHRVPFDRNDQFGAPNMHNSCLDLIEAAHKSLSFNHLNVAYSLDSTLSLYRGKIVFYIYHATSFNFRRVVS